MAPTCSYAGRAVCASEDKDMGIMTDMGMTTGRDPGAMLSLKGTMYSETGRQT